MDLPKPSTTGRIRRGQFSKGIIVLPVPVIATVEIDGIPFPSYIYFWMLRIFKVIRFISR